VSSVEAEPVTSASSRRGEPARRRFSTSARRLAARVATMLARGRRGDAEHLPVSPSAMNEELAVTLLYGKRSGGVTASPVRPPR
jgi:hypothetical protein